MNNIKSILFFLSHQPNPRFIKQINFFAENHAVCLVYFSRNEGILPDLINSLNKNVVVHNVGVISNLSITPNFNDHVKRLSIYIKALNFIRKLNKLNNFNIILINNIDVLIMQIITSLGLNNRKKIYVMEISDLQEFVFYNNLTSKIVRFLERSLYNIFVDKLIVTSKKYYDFHFSKFFKKGFFVLENKILSKEISLPDENIIIKSAIDKVIIGIVGLLLRKNEYVKLFETYKNSSEVEIHIYGVGQYQYIVESYSKKFSNIHYFGKYNAFVDSYKIYNSIDILYVVYDNDLTSKNNKLALPNKLYEAMYYKVPLICSRETYLEEIVKDLGIGLGINYKLNGELEYAVDKLTVDKIKITENFKKIPKEDFIADNDYVKLSDFLKLK